MKEYKARFCAQDGEINKFHSFFEDVLEQSGLKEWPAAFALKLAATEAFVNIMKHGYGGIYGEDAPIYVEFAVKNGIVKIKLRDRGVKFNPLTYKTVSLEENINNYSSSGFGINIYKKIMDTVEYSFENGENVLTLSKKVT